MSYYKPNTPAKAIFKLGRLLYYFVLAGPILLLIVGQIRGQSTLKAMDLWEH